MMNRLFAWVIPVWFTVTVLAASGNIVVEQDQISGSRIYNPGFGQSFLLPAGAQVGAIELCIPLLKRDGESLTIKLWRATGDPDSDAFLRMGDTPVATGSLDEEELNSDIKWYTIELDEPFTNQTQEPIYMVFEIGFPRTSSIRLNYFGFANTDPYDGGHAVSWNSNAYELFEGDDLSFRILEPTQPTVGGVVIEQKQITDKADYGSGFGQSFLLPAGANVGAIDLHIGSIGSGGGSAMLRLWKVDGNQGGHPRRSEVEPITSGLLDRDAIGGVPGWQTIVLDSSFSNDSDQPIELVFEVELLTSGANGYNDYSFSNEGPYNDGYSVFWDGSEYVIRDGQDLAFRILGDVPATPLADLKVTASPSSQLVTIVVPESISGFNYTCYSSQTMTSWTQVWDTKSGNGSSLTWYIQHVNHFPDQNFFKVETKVEP